MDFALPIDEVSGALCDALMTHVRAVLVAPPGAGKTTRVPLLLAEQSWAAGGRIVVLEPRRLAARAAAARMAQTLGEAVGATVGLRVRMESRVSAATRIEIVTEGVFARMILDDPSLDGIAAVVFDEFHERSLDADLGLALALDAQAGLREDLRILVMSATLDGARVAGLLDDAPVITSEGRAFPIVTRYVGRDPRARIEDEVVRVIDQALHADSGSLLVFLPGQGEITRTAERLKERIHDATIDIAPLFGAMDRKAQDLAVSPSVPGRRKIVLATSIAETSLTIDGVRVVIDSGLARVPRFEPDLGLTRLETVRVSRAAADQRRGRAGRTEPGICYRLWEEAATGALQPFAPPEILSADLSSLVLDLAQWGARDPMQLRWLDPPPAAALTEARTLLRALGALDEDGAITPEGRRIRSLPLPPRLARMVLEAARTGAARLAADIAAVIVERGVGGDGVDLTERVERLRRDRAGRAQDARRLARGWADQAQAFFPAMETIDDVSHVGRWVAVAFPDRVARARGKLGEFVMVNGRAAACEAHDALARETYLAIAEISGRAGASRILAAALITLEDIESLMGDRIETRDEISFDRASASVRARRMRRLGAVALNEQPRSIEGAESAMVLANGLAALGIDRLPWSKAQKQLRDRVLFLRRAEGDVWPDLSDAALAASAETWLAPFIEGRASLSAITADDLDSALQALLPWDMRRRLDIEAPTHFEAPTGSHIAVDYEAEGGPVLAVRVQELFGLSQHPSLAGGRVPLTLHLLSPAHRPIQITRDLPGFWKGSWAAVKSEMKGRYPRHVWPDDPANATATTRAKPRGT
ncbi:ATP-dependent helicase HrpB [Methylocella sp. CPCC 101449]|uniref:ATP-dependent helicase HrpB n=1 Tax=Methylocella sp. CPCC 101449 TaxID=2987531 RepID=UPI002890276E|nr:ATP-dependent helicase HrpB [Methylocella sp. CPCC 101449]MDT2019758.1 ATP-dependent helicase HrpB [Methylocella sp. CPCC 101449]